jgi:hypothetical protein
MRMPIPTTSEFAMSASSYLRSVIDHWHSGAVLDDVRPGLRLPSNLKFVDVKFLDLD